MNLYKVVFIGEKLEYTTIIIGYDSPELRLAQEKVPKENVTCICQTYGWAADAKCAINLVEIAAKEEGITVKDFQKVSLVCSREAIGKIMTERL